MTFAFAVEVVEFQTHRSVLRLVGHLFVASSNQRVKGAAVSGFCGLYSVVVGELFTTMDMEGDLVFNCQ